MEAEAVAGDGPRFVPGRFEWVALNDLEPHPRNANSGDVGAITGSVETLGFYGLILCRPFAGHYQILAGEHRWRALRQLGASRAPCWVMDDVDDETALRVLNDNRFTRLGHDQTDVLVENLRELAATPLGLTGTGFDGDDLNELLRDLEEPLAPQPTVSTVPPVPENPVTKPGQVWQVGLHRVACGDNQDLELLDRLLDGIDVGCLLADPPYGINLDTDYSKITGSAASMLNQPGQRRVVARDYRPVGGDTEPFDASVLSARFADVREQFWLGANYYRRTLPGTDLEGSWLVWDKRPAAWNEGSEGIDDVIGSSFELIWSKQRHQQRVLRHQWSGFTARNQGLPRAHPTEKSIQILTELLERWAPAGAAVLDPFAGSGTTLLAAARTGRSGFGIELDPGYVDVTVERLAAELGVVPVDVDTGEEFRPAPRPELSPS